MQAAHDAHICRIALSSTLYELFTRGSLNVVSRHTSHSFARCMYVPLHVKRHSISSISSSSSDGPESSPLLSEPEELPVDTDGGKVHTDTRLAAISTFTTWAATTRTAITRIIHFPRRTRVQGCSLYKWCRGLLLCLLCVLLTALCGLVYYRVRLGDSHGASQMMQVPACIAASTLNDIVSTLRWRARVVRYGGALEACEAHSTYSDAIEAHWLVQLSAADTAQLIGESLDGHSYEVYSHSHFSPHYLFSVSQPDLSFTSAISTTTDEVAATTATSNLTLLPCSTPSLRCESSRIRLFQQDLQAEERVDRVTARNDSSTQGGALVRGWTLPFASLHSSVDRALHAGEAPQCGSGVINLQESAHWWYYLHPMSCMRLVRSIGQRHQYCVNNGTATHTEQTVERTIFHIAMFGSRWRKQATLAVSSVLLTQDLKQTRLYIWIDRPLSSLLDTDYLSTLLAAYPEDIEIRLYDARQEVINSQNVLSASADWYASVKDDKGWLAGDLMRLLLLHNYGGVWLDADVLVLRDMSPILGQQFLYKWGSRCHHINGAIMRLFRRSAASVSLLDQLYRIVPIKNEFVWGRGLYQQVYEQQLARHKRAATATVSSAAINNASAASVVSASAITPSSLKDEDITIFPCCFFNPNWMDPEPFSALLDPTLPQNGWPGLWNGPFAYHLHGEVWNETGWAAQDYDYQTVARNILRTMDSILLTRAGHDKR